MLHHYSKSSGRGTQSYPQVSGVSGYSQLCNHTAREWGRKMKLQEQLRLVPSSLAAPFAILSHFWAKKAALSSEATH